MPHVRQALNRRFQLIMIKPSHYDDDGYVIRWWRAMIPSNSLAAIYGIASDCVERQVLGPDVDIDITVIDETNTRVNISALVDKLRRNDNSAWLPLSAFNPINIRVHSTSQSRSATPRSRFPSVDFMSRVVCRCWTVKLWGLMPAVTWRFPCLPANWS